MIYLATPYSDPDPKIRDFRYREVNKVAAQLINSGQHVFSPISYTHPIAQAGDLPKEWEYWESYDRKMIGCCQRFMILVLDGWRESKGVTAEKKIAEELGMQIEIIHPAVENRHESP